MSGHHHKPPWWRRVGRRPQASKPRPPVTEMVDGAGWAHWVTSEAFEQGLREGTGPLRGGVWAPDRRREHGRSTGAFLLALPEGPGLLSEWSELEQVCGTYGHCAVQRLSLRVAGVSAVGGHRHWWRPGSRLAAGRATPTPSLPAASRSLPRAR